MDRTARFGPDAADERRRIMSAFLRIRNGCRRIAERQRLRIAVPLVGDASRAVLARGLEFCGVDRRRACHGQDPWDEVVIGLDRMAPPDPELGPRWFLGARLNFAENLLRYRDDHEALVLRGTSGAGSASLTYRGAARARSRGWRPRCARTESASAIGSPASCPNIPEAVIAMLAAASASARSGRRARRTSEPRGARPLRADRAADSVLRRRLSLRREGDRLRSPGLREVRRADSGDRARGRGSLLATGNRTIAAIPRAQFGGTTSSVAATADRAAHVRAPAVRSSALHPVLVGHHRTAQVHGARRAAERCSSI